jgi:hypothetical protein
VSRDTAANPEFKATVAEDVGDRRFLGDLYRAVQWQQGHRCAEANAAGPLGRGSEHHQRIRKYRKFTNKVNLAEPRRIKADSISELYLYDDVFISLSLRISVSARQLVEESETHAFLPSFLIRAIRITR